MDTFIKGNYLRMLSDRAENSIMQTISIAVSAILIAAGLVTAPGLINNARDNNARTDLANIAYAQEYILGVQGKYFDGDYITIEQEMTGDGVSKAEATNNLQYLASNEGLNGLGTSVSIADNSSGGVAFTVSGDVSGHASIACGTEPYFIIKAQSGSGKWFYRGSGSGLTSSNYSEIYQNIPSKVFAECSDFGSGFEETNDQGDDQDNEPTVCDTAPEGYPLTETPNVYDYSMWGEQEYGYGISINSDTTNLPVDTETEEFKTNLPSYEFVTKSNGTVGKWMEPEDIFFCIGDELVPHKLAYTGEDYYYQDYVAGGGPLQLQITTGWELCDGWPSAMNEWWQNGRMIVMYNGQPNVFAMKFTQEPISALAGDPGYPASCENASPTPSGPPAPTNLPSIENFSNYSEDPDHSQGWLYHGVKNDTNTAAAFWINYADTVTVDGDLPGNVELTLGFDFGDGEQVWYLTGDTDISEAGVYPITITAENTLGSVQHQVDLKVVGWEPLVSTSYESGMSVETASSNGSVVIDRSWRRHTAGTSVQLNPPAGTRFLYAFMSDNGSIVTAVVRDDTTEWYRDVYLTTSLDGGYTWGSLNQICNTSSSCGPTRGHVSNDGDITLWPTNGSSIYYSDDNGFSWDIRTVPGAGAHKLAVSENGDVIAQVRISGSTGYFETSSDGGVTWSQVGPSNGTNVISSNVVIAVDNLGNVLYAHGTGGGGISWGYLSTNVSKTETNQMFTGDAISSSGIDLPGTNNELYWVSGVSLSGDGKIATILTPGYIWTKAMESTRSSSYSSSAATGWVATPLGDYANTTLVHLSGRHVVVDGQQFIWRE